MRIRKALAAIGTAGALAVSLAACGDPSDDQDQSTVEMDDEDCDEEDARNHEPECGYADSSGVWFWYVWVTPNRGGHPPTGQHPRPPAGARTVPLKRVTVPANRGGTNPVNRPPAPKNDGGDRGKKLCNAFTLDGLTRGGGGGSSGGGRSGGSGSKVTPPKPAPVGGDRGKGGTSQHGC